MKAAEPANEQLRPTSAPLSLQPPPPFCTNRPRRGGGEGGGGRKGREEGEEFPRLDSSLLLALFCFRSGVRTNPRQITEEE